MSTNLADHVEDPATTITALRARVEALEGALARADRLIDALWTDQIVPEEHGGTRSAIRAALRAKGGGNGDA